jgi:hypothetical protein
MIADNQGSEAMVPFLLEAYLLHTSKQEPHLQVNEGIPRPIVVCQAEIHKQAVILQLLARMHEDELL